MSMKNGFDTIWLVSSVGRASVCQSEGIWYLKQIPSDWKTDALPTEVREYSCQNIRVKNPE